MRRTTIETYTSKQRVVDIFFASRKPVISAKRDAIARAAIAQDVEWLLCNTFIIPHVQPTLADIHATVQLPEERITIKLPELN